MKLVPILRKLVFARAALGAFRMVNAALQRRQGSQRRNRTLTVLGGVAAGAGLVWLIFARLFRAPQIESPSLQQRETSLRAGSALPRPPRTFARAW